MWFKDIANWSQKKLKFNFLIYGIIYLVFALIVPIIIVATKYELIKSSSTRLTGVGLILVICIVLFLIKGVKNLLNKLPQEEHKEQCFKFTIIMLYNMLLPVIGLLVVRAIKQDVVLACDTITYCLYSLIIANVIDCMTLKFLEVEWDLRQDAKHQIQVNKRITTLTQ